MDEFVAVAGLGVELKRWGRRPIYLHRNLYKSATKPPQKSTQKGFSKLVFNVGSGSDQECKLQWTKEGESYESSKVKHDSTFAQTEVVITARVSQRPVQHLLKSLQNALRCTRVNCPVQYSGDSIRLFPTKISSILDDRALFCHNISIEMTVTDPKFLTYLAKRVPNIVLSGRKRLVLYSKWIPANNLQGPRSVVLYSHSDPQLYFIVQGEFETTADRDYATKKVQNGAVNGNTPSQSIAVTLKGKGRMVPQTIHMHEPRCLFCLGLPFATPEDLIHHIDNYHIYLRCRIKEEQGLYLTTKHSGVDTGVDFDLLHGTFHAAEMEDTFQGLASSYPVVSQVSESQDESDSLEVQKPNPFQGMIFYDLSQDYEDSDEWVSPESPRKAKTSPLLQMIRRSDRNRDPSAVKKLDSSVEGPRTRKRKRTPPFSIESPVAPPKRRRGRRKNVVVETPIPSVDLSPLKVTGQRAIVGSSSAIKLPQKVPRGRKRTAIEPAPPIPEEAPRKRGPGRPPKIRR